MYDSKEFRSQLDDFVIGLVPSALFHVPIGQLFKSEDLAVVPELTTSTSLDEIVVRWGFRMLVAYARKRLADMGMNVNLQVWFNAAEPLKGVLTWHWQCANGTENIDLYELNGRFWLPREAPEPPPGYKVVTVTKGGYTAKLWERVADAP